VTKFGPGPLAAFVVKHFAFKSGVEKQRADERPFFLFRKTTVNFFLAAIQGNGPKNENKYGLKKRRWLPRGIFRST
jgi:hypothetical protein